MERNNGGWSREQRQFMEDYKMPESKLQHFSPKRLRNFSVKNDWQQQVPYRLPLKELVLKGLNLDNVPAFESTSLEDGLKWLKSVSKKYKHHTLPIQRWEHRLLAEDMQQNSFFSRY